MQQKKAKTILKILCDSAKALKDLNDQENTDTKDFEVILEKLCTIPKVNKETVSNCHTPTDKKKVSL